MNTLGILGFGNMGEAFGAGLRRADPEVSLIVYDPLPQRNAAAAEICNATPVSSPEELARAAGTILLAVKPQEIGQALSEPAFRDGKHRYISIAAGVSLQKLNELTGSGDLCRLMPNLAARQGQALVAAAFPDGTEESFRKEALGVAGAAGRALEIKEELMPAIIGLSGSGIAFVFSFIHALALAGTDEGIRYPDSLDAALQTLRGAVAALEDSGDHPEAMLSRVISPGGTTIRGVRALAEEGFTASVMHAVRESAARAREMEG